MWQIVMVWKCYFWVTKKEKAEIRKTCKLTRTSHCRCIQVHLIDRKQVLIQKIMKAPSWEHDEKTKAFSYTNICIPYIYNQKLACPLAIRTTVVAWFLWGRTRWAPWSMWSRQRNHVPSADVSFPLRCCWRVSLSESFGRWRVVEYGQKTWVGELSSLASPGPLDLHRTPRERRISLPPASAHPFRVEDGW